MAAIVMWPGELHAKSRPVENNKTKEVKTATAIFFIAAMFNSVERRQISSKATQFDLVRLDFRHAAKTDCLVRLQPIALEHSL
jgi:phenylalanyl-tRNA synthetase alpha subunit